MKIKFIEAHDQTKFNWGKFAICRWENEFDYKSSVDERPLLSGRGWGKDHVWILDLQTGEGFCTTTTGLPVADLNKHSIWCCPMFEPFLNWLYQQDISDLDSLPSVVDLGDVPTAMAGYRRQGM